MNSIRPWLSFLVVFALGSSGCLLAGNYHSAKTLGKGASSVGGTVSSATFEVVIDEVTGDRSRVVQLPGVVPEFSYHVGVADDLDIGGRLGLLQLAMEGDIKYRFVSSGGVHLAVAPSVAVQSLDAISGLALRVPVLATYELSDHMAATASLAITSSNYTTAGLDALDGQKFAAFSGSLVSAGGSLALEFSRGRYALRPAVEYTRYMVRLDRGEFVPFSTVSVAVHVQVLFSEPQ